MWHEVLKCVVINSAESWHSQFTSASTEPALLVYVANHPVAELLSFLNNYILTLMLPAECGIFRRTFLWLDLLHKAHTGIQSAWDRPNLSKKKNSWQAKLVYFIHVEVIGTLDSDYLEG